MERVPGNGNLQAELAGHGHVLAPLLFPGWHECVHVVCLLCLPACGPDPALQLARDNGVHFTEVIRNGQMLGVQDRRNARTVSTGSMNVLGEAALQLLYNDGNKVGGRGSREGLQVQRYLSLLDQAVCGGPERETELLSDCVGTVGLTAAARQTFALSLRRQDCANQ